MPRLIGIVRKGPRWKRGFKLQDQPEMARHLAHVKAYLRDGAIDRAGPFFAADGTYAGGLILFAEVERAVVERIVRTDPVVTSGVLTITLHPWDA